MKKITICVLALLLIGGTLFASGQHEPQGDTDAQKVHMWLMGSEKDSTKQYMDEAIAGFTAETGIDVSYQFVAWGDGFKKISTAIAAGEGPDICQVGTTWVANFQATGAFENLSEDVGSLLPSADTFTPGAWATSGYGGEVYAIPWFSDIRGMVYRSDLWTEAGYPDGPQSWKDIEEGGKKIMSANTGLESVVGLRGQGFGHFVGSLIWQNCGDFISQDGTKATWNHPKNVEAVQWFADLIDQGIISKENGEWTNDDIMARFWEGKIAVMFVSPEFVSLASDQQFDALKDSIAVGPQPRGYQGGRYGFVGGSDLMLFEYSPRKAAAKQFLAYLSKPEIQELKTKYENRAPAVNAAYDLPELSKGWWPGFFASAQYGRHFPIHPAWGDMESLMPELKSEVYSAFIDGVYNSDTVKELLDKKNAEAQRKIDMVGGVSDSYSWEWPSAN